MTKQIRVTRKRRRWAESRSTIIKGDPLTYPAAAEERYRSSIERLIAQMAKQYEKELAKVIRESSEIAMDANIGAEANRVLSELARTWRAKFSGASRRIVKRMMTQVDNQSKANLGKSLKKLSGGISIATPKMPEAMQDIISASVAENVRLITNIQAQYAMRIESAVLSSIQSGGQGQKTVIDQLRKISGMSERRAKLIAGDQVRKVTSQYNKARAQSVGIKQFQWVHSGGGVDKRELHVKYNGMVFDYDDLPIIDERTGERGLPGQLINCRCQAAPVLSF